MYVKRFLMPHKNPFGSTASQRVRVGISRCLLGEPVRYDGGHRYNGYINKILGKCFEFVAVCPEVVIGLGTPRPPLLLVGDAHAPRAVGVDDPGFDVTERLDEYARSMVEPCRYLKRDIDAGAGADLVRLIAEYRLGRVPLAVPITVLKDHFRRYPDPSLGHRLYLDPYPEALELRHLI